MTKITNPVELRHLVNSLKRDLKKVTEECDQAQKSCEIWAKGCRKLADDLALLSGRALGASVTPVDDEDRLSRTVQGSSPEYWRQSRERDEAERAVEQQEIELAAEQEPLTLEQIRILLAEGEEISRRLALEFVELSRLKPEDYARRLG